MYDLSFIIYYYCLVQKKQGKEKKHSVYNTNPMNYSLKCAVCYCPVQDKKLDKKLPTPKQSI